MADPHRRPDSTEHDPTRRRLTRAGLAAPVILASLASKPVLGAPRFGAAHNCTISGQLSGNVSTHTQVECATLGKAPAHYYNAGQSPASWPNAAADFLDATNKPLPFPSTPASAAQHFADAYRKCPSSGCIVGADTATVWDVLAGFVVNVADGQQNTDWTLSARTGFVTDLALGREAVAAYMSAWNVAECPNYPLTPAEVVQMFNAVVQGGGYEIGPGVYWNAANVLTYFQSLHA